LAGIKVLDLTRVLAGPVASRFLAGLGADVLRIDPPTWNEPGVVPDVTLGKRCARLDLQVKADRELFEGLLKDADILLHGYRADALERLGYGLAERQLLAPGLIDVCLNAYGWSGPWQNRRGFDSLVQMSSGIAEAGMHWQHADKPTPLPLQALDHATGYLMAASAIKLLVQRLSDGLGGSARLSLARTAKLLIGAGAGTDEPLRAEEESDQGLLVEQTPWGPAHRGKPAGFLFGYLALPAVPGQRGVPDPSGVPGTSPTVWQTWKEVHEVYLAGGAAPPPWKDGGPSGPPTLSLTEIDGTTLTDVNGNPITYTVLMNQGTFEYLVTRALYGWNGQAALRSVGAAPVVFPTSAMEVKASWKILDPIAG